MAGWRVRSAMVLFVKGLNVGIGVEERKKITDGGKSSIFI
jgi:hypothetical protein